jgi:hypothetical protein
LSTGVTYYWQVRAVNAGGTTYANGGTWWSFTTIPPAPGSFSKSNPASGTTNAPASPTLSWETASGATSYEYCMDGTNNSACDGSWVSTGASTSVRFAGLNIGTYYWQVRAVNAGGTTYANGGTWWSFATVPTFEDVPGSYWAFTSIERLYSAAITGGCGTTTLIYCPDNLVTRAQMAVFLERGMQGAGYTPPAGTGLVFTDVLSGYWALGWIEKLYADGITGGCNPNPLMYCPENPVTRAQMAIFLLRAKHGAAYTPPAASGTVFTDIPSTYWAAAWIEQLASEGITSGCSGGLYCPEDSVKRDQMAVFLVRTFGLP